MATARRVSMKRMREMAFDIRQSPPSISDLRVYGREDVWVCGGMGWGGVGVGVKLTILCQSLPHSNESESVAVQDTTKLKTA